MAVTTRINDGESKADVKKMNCAKAKRSLEDSYKILRSELVVIADKQKKLNKPKK